MTPAAATPGRSTRRLAGALLAACTLAATAGCTALPGGAPSGPSYQVSADFTEVLDLVPQAAVKVNDVTVGSVVKISLSGWDARVRMKIDRDVQLPANRPGAAGSIAINSDFSNEGKAVDIYEIKVSVVE